MMVSFSESYMPRCFTLRREAGVNALTHSRGAGVIAELDVPGFAEPVNHRRLSPSVGVPLAVVQPGQQHLLRWS
jgi:hypothetical protein